MGMIKYNKVKRGGRIKTHVLVVEGYRPGPGQATKQRTIKSFGYLEEQEDRESFMREVEEFNATCRAGNAPMRIEASGAATMYSDENRRLNYGYRYLEAVYDSLGIDGFIDARMEKCGFRGEYAPSEIFKFLVMARILAPDSKRASCQMKNGLYGFRSDFTLSDIYRSLGHFAGFETEIQRHLNERVKAGVGRDLSHAFYDVTNYFFEIDFPDGDGDLRRRGVSKEHRVDPIAAMGLFMDSNGLPVSMSIFPGNTSDSLTLQPTVKDAKESYGLGRLVVVADKGMNSSKNIDAAVNAGDGFVFSQALRGTKGRRYADKLSDSAGWAENAGGTRRWKLFREEYSGKDEDGKAVARERNVLIYWSKADADMARRKRGEKLEKAARSAKSNAYGIRKGQGEYVKEDYLVKETGEYLEEGEVKKIKSVDTDKAEADALYDGHFCIITSELDYDERKIRQVYGGLWMIEQSFRVMKSDLCARPVFVRKNEHIRAHFLICFVALLVIRAIQLRMGKNALSAERIARALNAATCRLHKGGIVHLDDVGGAIAFRKAKNKKGEIVETLAFSSDDEIALDYRALQRLFGADCCKVFVRQEDFNRFLKSIAVS
jgi:hypothetical protein